MNVTIVQAVVRHILTAVAGGFFVQHGISGDVQNAIIGGIAALVGVGWSIFDKRRVAASAAS